MANYKLIEKIIQIEVLKRRQVSKVYGRSYLILFGKETSTRLDARN